MTILATPFSVRPELSIKDSTLLGWGQDLADQHRADPWDPARCSNQQCAPRSGYPCHPRRIADRLIAASTAGWPHCWTARLDALSCGVQPIEATPVGITRGIAPSHDCSSGGRR